MNSDRFVVRNLFGWILTFVIVSLFESAIRILFFHKAWNVSAALEFLILNLGVAILFAMVAGSLHFILITFLDKSGRHGRKLKTLFLPTAAFAFSFLFLVELWSGSGQLIPPVLSNSPFLKYTVLSASFLLMFLISKFIASHLSARSRRILLYLLLVTPGVILIQHFFSGRVRVEKNSNGPVQHVVLISIDTLRHDYVGAYGAMDVSTPAMDQVAREGALFKVAVAPVPQTGPSHTTMFTGQTPLVHGIHTNGRRLSTSKWTVTKSLRDAGFRTAAFISGYPLTATNCGLHHGFQVYDDDLASIDRFNETYLGALLERTGFFRPGILKLSPDVTNPALAWLQNNAKSPFFLFLHYYDSHYPYDYAQKLRRHPQWITSNPKDLPRQKQFYKRTVEKVDAEIGRVIEALKRLGIYDQTLLIITSDHGESLGEHDYYYDHYRKLYEQLIRVPMIIRSPAMIRPGSKIEQQVSLMDIPKSILASVGLPVPKELGGYDLIQLSRVVPANYNRVTLSHAFETRVSAIRTDEWKLIRTEKNAKKNYELYRLISDPGERLNLFQTERDKARELKKLMSSLVDEMAPDGDAHPKLTPEQIERLRSLGYIQ